MCHLVINGKLRSILEVVKPAASHGVSSDDFSPQPLLQTVANLIKSANQINDPVQTDVQRAEVIESSAILAEELVTLILQTQILDEATTSLPVGQLSIIAQRVRASDIWQTLSADGCEFHIPKGLLSNYGDTEVLQVAFTNPDNPFTWGYSNGKGITTKVPALSFKLPNGSHIAIKGLDDNGRIKIIMPSSSAKQKNTKSQKKMENYLPYSSHLVEAYRSVVYALDKTVALEDAAMHIKIHFTAHQEDAPEITCGENRSHIAVYLGKEYVATSEKYEVSVNISSPSKEDDKQHLQDIFISKR